MSEEVKSANGLPASDDAVPADGVTPTAVSTASDDHADSRPLPPAGESHFADMGRDGGGFWWTAAICFVVALSLRWIAGSTEFWMDEIWTWKLAQLAQTPWDVLTRIKHDNNHLLNTLVFHCLGPDQPWFYYRLPAIMAGALAIPIAGAIHWKANRLRACILMILLATNYQLIHYGSEARGYGYLILFTLLAILLASRSLDRSRPVNDLIFSLVCVLGFAAHSTFIFCFLAIGLWFVYRWVKESAVRKFGLPSMLRCSILPIVFVAWTYVTVTSQMTIGGGEGRTVATAVNNLLSSVFGAQALAYPYPVPWAVGLTTWIAILMLAAGVLWLWRKQPGWAVLYVAGFLVAPALVLILMNPQLLYTRYFLVPIVFLLMLTAHGTAELIGSTSGGSKSLGNHSTRAALTSLGLAVVVAGNLFGVYHLSTLGRGHYREAIELMLSPVASSDLDAAEGLPPDAQLTSVTVSSDYDMRHQMILSFFQRTEDPQQRLIYVLAKEVPAQGVDWMVLHDPDPRATPQDHFQDAHGNAYQLDTTYRYCGASGWVLSLYRRTE